MDRTHLITTLRVSGMTCDHCKKSVTEALEKLPGVSRVEVDLDTKEVTVAHDAQVGRDQMRQAIQAVGFEVG